MTNVLIETATNIVVSVLLVALEILGVWVLAKFGKSKAFQTTAQAMYELSDATRTTVLELQQTVVDGLKQDAADGKLTKQEIADLGKLLVEMTMQKLSEQTTNLLSAAGIDIVANIHGFGEAYIASFKDNTRDP